MDLGEGIPLPRCNQPLHSKTNYHGDVLRVQSNDDESDSPATLVRGYCTSFVSVSFFPAGFYAVLTPTYAIGFMSGTLFCDTFS